MTSREFKERLERRASRVDIAVDEEIAGRIEVYFRLLQTWNRRINLTAFQLDQPTDAAFDRLLIEPLAASAQVPDGTRYTIDIGSGGGSPAIPLAISRPDIRLRMVESKARKSVFLTEAIRAVGLPGAEVLTERFETLVRRTDLIGVHDLLTIRAVRSDADTLNQLQPFLKSGGLVFLFSGAPTDASPTVLPPLLFWRTVPLVEASQSRLIILKKS